MMNKKWFVIIAIMVCVCMACTCLVACAPKIDGGIEDGDGNGDGGDGGGDVIVKNDFIFGVTERNEYFIRKYVGTAKDVTLPTEYEGHTITSLFLSQTHDPEASIMAFADTTIEILRIPASIVKITGCDVDNVAQMQWTINAFSGATNLQKIIVAPENPVFSDIDGVLYNKDKTVMLACPYDYKSKLVVPEGVIAISLAAFGSYAIDPNDPTDIVEYKGYERSKWGLHSAKITEVELPTTLKYATFQGCRQLKSLDLSKTQVTAITLQGMKYTESLKEIKLPDCLKYIGIDAFVKSGIERIEIPAGVLPRSLSNYTTIMQYEENNTLKVTQSSDIFVGCSDLKYVSAPSEILFGGGYRDQHYNNFIGCDALAGIHVNGSATNSTHYAPHYKRSSSIFVSESIVVANSFTSLKVISYSNILESKIIKDTTEFLKHYKGVEIRINK